MKEKMIYDFQSYQGSILTFMIPIHCIDYLNLSILSRFNFNLVDYLQDQNRHRLSILSRFNFNLFNGKNFTKYVNHFQSYQGSILTT